MAELLVFDSCGSPESFNTSFSLQNRLAPVAPEHHIGALGCGGQKGLLSTVLFFRGLLH